MFKCAKFLGAGALVAALCAPAQAAYYFDTVGDSILTAYSVNIGYVLSATVEYELNTLNAQSAVFEVTVKNTTTDTSEDNRLVAFGVGVVNPELVSVSDPSNNGWTTLVDQSITNTNVDFCAIGSGDSANNCSGGGSGGVEPGDTFSFLVTMNFATPIPESGVMFDSPFRIRYQSIDGTFEGENVTSLAFNGCVVGDPNCDRPPQELPEPGSMALAGLALLGAGLARRRRQLA